MDQGPKNLATQIMKIFGILLFNALLLAPCVDATVSHVLDDAIPMDGSGPRLQAPWSNKQIHSHTLSSGSQDMARRRLAVLGPPQPQILPYHNGPILSGKNNITKLYVIFYGDISRQKRHIVRRFLRSLAPPRRRPRASIPTVAKWWEITKGYQNVYGEPVAPLLIPSGDMHDETYSRGKNLNQSDVEALVLKSLPSFGVDARSLYIVLTAMDVEVTGFCREACGQHAYLYPSDATYGQMLPYIWVGDSSTQCAKLCCWPFAYSGDKSEQPEARWLPPNGDLGADGMIINLAKLIAGAATDPYQNAYYQGDAAAPVEAAEACGGLFGRGASVGFPGQVMLDGDTGASFNVFGFHGDKFLVPWLWNPKTFACAGQS